MEKIDLIGNKTFKFKEVYEDSFNTILVYWNFVLVMLVLIFLILSYFIKYPDIIVSKAEIVSTNPSVIVKPRISGNIDHVFKETGEKVDKGDWVLILDKGESTVKDLVKLDSIIYSLKETKISWSSLDLSEDLELGELKPLYNDLVTQIKIYNHHREDGIDSFKFNTLQKELNHIEHMIKLVKGELKLAKIEVDIQKSDYLRDKELISKGVISKRDFEKSKLKMLQQERRFFDVESKLLQLKDKRLGIVNQAKDLEHKVEENEIDSKYGFNELLLKLEVKYNEWKENHVLKSPVNGYVNYLSLIYLNKYVEKNEPLMSIEDKSKVNEVFAILEVPIKNFGKLKENQVVNIKLESYPYAEFGVIKGRLEFLSESIKNGSYFAKVKLENGFKTSYGKKIRFRHNLKGSGEIITEDLRLIERFVHLLRF
ncbi:HlyD family secretion protein [Tenacibaculum sp. TC6]|uniref:HlyD family secretion protein n=1 Tax=Tenacibaculum sp. TC6 TaxID=3423223 RepID=UPI003D35DC4E